MPTIKQLIIGSDDDDLNIDSLPTINYDETHSSNLDAIQMHEKSTDGEWATDRLIPFNDPAYYQQAYDLGYQTFMSYSDISKESNEIVYLIKE